MLELKNVSKVYKTKKGLKTQALKNISFKLPNKGLFFILGKSGSGKSTLLNIIGGLDKQDSGEVIIDNKNIKKFKSKDYDYYRNTYVGFVFQEFNLLDEYNVTDNIILSRKLQREKVNYNTFNDLINKVGINGLEKRRINELSGGQKQRVALARALYKNPSIILADEPTGSLDEETGRQIFNLLKSISKEKLVIVVSHDKESAQMYADGIIEIHDGEIISNNIQTQDIISQDFKSKKSKLPFLSSLKFALLNLGGSKIKLIFTIILLFMSITFFGVSRILSKFNIEKSYANAMVTNNQKYVTISKASYNDIEKTWYYSGSYQKLDETDINEISSLLNNDFVYQYKLIENNENLGLDINYKEFITENRNAYYFTFPNYQYFIEASPDFIDREIIGSYPINNDEILIHSYLADYIMQAGVLLSNDSVTTKLEYYKPTSYEQIVNEQKYLKLGSMKVKIVGIILDDTNKFENLKNTNISSYSSQWIGIPDYKNNYYEFEMTIAKEAQKIYVAKGFIQNLNLKKNIALDSSINVKTTYKGKDYYTSNTYSYLDKSLNVYNGVSNVVINSLSNNQIIINESFLDTISNREYSKSKESYIEQYNENLTNIQNENQIIQENNQKLLEEYNKKITEVEDPETIEKPNLQEQKEEIIKTEEELNTEFLVNYLTENNIINSSITITFIGNSDKTEYKYENVTIVGIQRENNDIIYMSSEMAQELMKENSNLVALITKSDDSKKLEQIFKNFPIDDAKYLSSTVYSSPINIVRDSLESISSIAFYASLIFGLFAFILLTNFIVTSIQSNKKTIGILRALGARKLDIFKIFLIEGFLIVFISLILTLITLYIAMYFTNNYISSKLFFDINFVMLSIENLIIIIGSVIMVTFLSSLLTVGKISKMKPIDAILNK